MADYKLLKKQNAEDGFFADDDPLAALARIASFDPQAEARPRPLNQRREPEFNLEDELLKEFEQYEEPAAGIPVVEAEADSLPAAIEPAATFDPSFGEEELVAANPTLAVVADIPRDVPELRAVPRSEIAVPVEECRPVSHPVFDLEDEILKEFVAFDARRAVSAPRIEPPAIHGLAARPVPAVEPEPVRNFAPVVQAAAPVAVRAEPAFERSMPDDVPASHDAYSGYGDDDLTTEPELSLDAGHFDELTLDMAALDAMEAEVDPARWHETKEQILVEEEASETIKAVEPVHLGFNAAIDDPQRWDDAVSNEPSAFEDESTLAAALDIDAEPEAYVEPDDVQPEPVIDVPAPVQFAAPVVSVAAEPAARNEDHFSLDSLLAEVERYPVAATPARGFNSTSQPAPVAQPAMPAEQPASVVADTMLASVDEVAPVSEPKVLAPFVNAGIAPIITPQSEPLIVSKKVAPAIVSVPAAEPLAAPKAEPSFARKAEPVEARKDIEPFDDGAFELDLSEIELDMLEMEVESSVAPALHEDQIVASQAALAEVAETKVEEKPSRERGLAARPPVEDYSSLPFDPSQVSTEEDPVEALADLDVPEAPVVDHEVPVPTKTDYDIDIDAEIAHIFARPGEAVQQQPAASQMKPGQPAEAAATTMTSADLDEFERALEEDFRRSLSENRATSTPDRVALTPPSYDTGKREGATGRRILVLAASVAGLVLVGGAGVYAYWGSAGKILSASTEPKIILADKDPVKVQPKDRGGQTVPNQDKAVYDRVSGDGKDITKQERLVTSNEEPVDVVQKTLMPEALPMDDEDQTSATDTTDTSDPRLLPNGQDENITKTEKVVSGVSPRKVRTMVVRSDGTLVARDEPAADEARDAVPADASKERSVDVTPAAAENVPDRLAANDDIAKEIQEASADKAFVPNAQKPSDAAADKSAKVQDTQPVTETEAKPVAADAVRVSKQDLAAPATQNDTAAAQDAAPADQAALTEAANAQVDETAPIRAVKTTTITADTPIPENRPVDQPVDIVGRVTDQGNVKKTEDVASADPVQPVDNAQTTATPVGGYVIQIASLPSAEEAQSSYNKLSAKFASVIGGHGVDIRKAAIKNKGTYYRVRIPAGTRQEATDLCARYKAAGGSCLVSK